MATTPTVRPLADIMAELDPAYSQQTGIIQNQIAGLGTKYAAQEAALGAKKTEGFNQINNQATARGLSFSGIPLDEQATYLADTYLPAVANLKSSQNDETTALNKSLADIYTDKYTKAYDINNTDRSALNSWNLQQMQNEFTASESSKDRAASASSGSTPAQDYSASLLSQTGKDGYVSPATYKANRNDWIISGYGTAADFDSLFAGYRNPYSEDTKSGTKRSTTDYGVK